MVLKFIAKAASLASVVPTVGVIHLQALKARFELARGHGMWLAEGPMVMSQ